MRRRLLLLLVATVPFAMPADAHGASRSGTTSEGVRLSLEGRVLTMTVPRQTARRAVLRVECATPSRPGDLRRRRSGARASRVVMPGVRVRMRLGRDVSRAADWCAFSTARRDASERMLPFGAAPLRPPRRPSPPAVTPGPGVRVVTTSEDDRVGGNEVEGGDGDATFLLSGRRLTVRLAAARAHSTVVTLVCNRADARWDEVLGIAEVAVGAGRRTITADLTGDPTGATYCLIEDDLRGGDIAAAPLP